MKTTEKLKLIRQIAEKLAEEEWSIINLTLEQFNIPIGKSSKAKPFDYVISKIRKADPQSLTDLAVHLDIEAPKTTDELSFWKEGNVRLFISHLAREKVGASELRDELEKFAVSAFVAHEDITPSKQWQNEIENALITCDALVALMVPGFHESYWTDQEVGFAYGRSVPVIPVSMGEKPYGFIGKIQAYKFEDMPTLSDTIFRLLISDPRTSRKMSYALMEQFEKSPSFNAAHQNLKLLKKAKYWDNTLIERLKAAPKKNNQIKGSFDVPEGIQALVKKLKDKVRPNPLHN